jgi:hypothetical protein
VAVITEVDRALVNLLATHTYSNERVQVDLDPPNKDWAARRSGPVLNLFLNDVREDTTKRSANMIETRNEEGLVISRRPQERTFMFTYALSAWTSRPEDDHALLSAALLALLRQDYLPAELCTGHLADLANGGRPAILRVGGLLFSERLATELWTSIGGEYRPTIAITVSTVIQAGLPTPAGPAQTEPPKFVFQDMPRDVVEEVHGPDPSEPPAPDGLEQRVRKRYRLAKESQISGRPKDQPSG